MSKTRNLLDKSEIENLIDKKGDYYVCTSRGRFEHIINSIVNEYFDDDSEDSQKNKILDMLEKISKKMLKKKDFYPLYEKAVRELCAENFVSGKIPQIDNIERVLKYLSDINDNIVEIFKLLRSCRDIKSNAKIISWMKHNKLICQSATLIKNKNFADLKKAIEGCNKPGDASSAINILETMESNRKTILEYLQTTLTRHSDDKKALSNIKRACLEEKVRILEEKLKEKTKQLNDKRFVYESWDNFCQGTDRVFFETANEKLEENMVDVLDSKFNPVSLTKLDIEPDSSGFDFSQGPIGALFSLTDSVWHKVYKGGSTAAARGWKMHISPILIKCTDVFGLVVEVWKKLNFDFKFQGALPLYRAINKIKSGEDMSKEKNVSEEIGKLSQEGKFIAIYPKNDSHANAIAEQLNSKFKSAGLSKSDFLKVRFDFGIYPGIYARLCHYDDKDGDSGRDRFCINENTLKEHAKSQGVDTQDYEHPFKYLFMGSKPMPKKVIDIMEITNSKTTKQDPEKQLLNYRKNIAKRKINDTEFMINNWWFDD